MSRLGMPVIPDRAPSVLENVGYTQWTLSTQAAAELYAKGAKLWTKESLRDIEQQLAEFRTREFFTLRKLDGSTIRVRNPMFGKSDPIWKPRVVFHEYWRLVCAKPGFHPNGNPVPGGEVQPETYHCPYLVEWRNQTLSDFEGLTDGWETLVQQKKMFWGFSETRQLLHTRIRSLVGPGSGRKANKVVCIGLPCLSRRPPSWWRINNRGSETPETEVDAMHKDSMTQYCAAMTIADALRMENGDHDPAARGSGHKAVRLITQETRYTEATKEYLRSLKFEVLGEHGAGGLAEIDDETVVVSFYTSTMAPVKQVVADLARPALFIGLFDSEDFNVHWQPGVNPESPRTRAMWEDYEVSDFPLAADETSPMGPIFKRLKVMARSAGDDSA